MERRFKVTVGILVAINDVLDDRYQKLSDRYHSLELSHNRKKVALGEIIRIIDEDIPGYNPNPILYIDLFVRIKRLCNNALWSDGRERQAPVKKKITMATVKARKK